MVDFLVSFFNWFWKSHLGLWVFFLALIPIVGFQIVIRLPNPNSRRRGKRNVRSSR